MKILVTGGAGFIGSNFISQLLNTDYSILNIDKDEDHFFLNQQLTHCSHQNYIFERMNILDANKISKIINKFSPDCIVHFAAESHVDNSIIKPDLFIETNIKGTFNLLQGCKDLISKPNFLFLHVSTDEVFGDLLPNEMPFTESDQYKPNSPYSASKAASDHMVRAFSKTYGLRSVITNCSNNFGPNQHPEKLIPHAIMRLLNGLKIPVYGSGLQIRDWLHVSDHCSAIFKIISNFTGDHSTYNIGSNNELTNIDLLSKLIYMHFDNPSDISLYLQHVTDRKGHDQRYSINSSKLENDFSWTSKQDFDQALKETYEWYVSNQWIFENNQSVLSRIITEKIAS